MTAPGLGMLGTGLVSSVGLSAPAACAAIRARLTNPSETRFIDSSGDWIAAHQVPLAQPWRGLTKLAKMAALAIEECLAGISREHWQRIPLILCVAERERPGRLEGLDARLLPEIQRELRAEFDGRSMIVPHGRVSTGLALMRARELMAEPATPYVLIAATDTFLSSATLGAYAVGDRLLTPRNCNGFIPGEGAGAVLLGPVTGAAQLTCVGIGFGTEPAQVDSEEPLRADGLTRAIRNALADAGCELHDLDFRITDLSGEQYYFKEAALALGRILRRRKAEFDIWHPAECIGETGATAGVAMMAVAEAACRKGYAPGHHILAHMANDAGERAAAVWHFSGNGRGE